MDRPAQHAFSLPLKAVRGWEKKFAAFWVVELEYPIVQSCCSVAVQVLYGRENKILLYCCITGVRLGFLFTINCLKTFQKRMI